MVTWHRGPDTDLQPNLALDRALHEQMLHCLQVLNVEWVEILIRPFPLKQAVRRLIVLVEFLVAHVTSLSPSLTCEVFIAEPLMPPPMSCEVVDLQSDLVVSPASLPLPPPSVMDAPAAVVGSSTPPAVSLELQAAGVRESFKVKPPNLSSLEVFLRGVAFVCSRRSARLTAKHRGGTFELLGPHRLLPGKVVLRQHMSCPKSCSLRGGASSDLRYFATAPPGHVGYHE
jgi:hypothetical protein